MNKKEILQKRLSEINKEAQALCESKEELDEWLGGAKNIFNRGVKAAERGMHNAYNSVEQGVKQAGQSITQGAKAAERGVRNTYNSVEQGVKNAGQAITKGANAVTGAVGKGVQKAGNAYVNAVDGAVQGIQQTGQKVKDAYKQGEAMAVQKKVGQLKSNFESLKTSYESLTGQKLRGNMAQQINQILNSKI